MGYMEIEERRWNFMYQQSIEHWKGLGYPPEEAREKANKFMRGWVGRSGAIQREYELDDRDRANGAGPEGREWFE